MDLNIADHSVDNRIESMGRSRENSGVMLNMEVLPLSTFDFARN